METRQKRVENIKSALMLVTAGLAAHESIKSSVNLLARDLDNTRVTLNLIMDDVIDVLEYADRKTDGGDWNDMVSQKVAVVFRSCALRIDQALRDSARNNVRAMMNITDSLSEDVAEMMVIFCREFYDQLGGKLNSRLDGVFKVNINGNVFVEMGGQIGKLSSELYYTENEYE